MIISSGHEELGIIDLDGVMSVIITSRGATLTTAFIAEAATRNIPVITCDSHHKPSTLLLPIVEHSDQTRRFNLQASAKAGLKNKVWKQLVAAKVQNQASLLKLVRAPGEERLNRLSRQIRPGDPSNIEAQAAQIYWRDLLGSDFRRNRNTPGINSLLNYGYAILRSSMTSAVLSVGLHPTFSVFHRSANNPLGLVDDLMEPYRPIVDQVVRRVVDDKSYDLTPSTKRILASVVTADQQTAGKMTPLMQHMTQLAYAFYEQLDGQSSRMERPNLLSGLELEAIISEC